MVTKNLAFRSLPRVAVAEGATTPDPTEAGVVAWSTTLNAVVVWNGTTWGSLPSYSEVTETKPVPTVNDKLVILDAADGGVAKIIDIGDLPFTGGSSNPATITHNGAGEDPVVGDTLTVNFTGGWGGPVQWLRGEDEIVGATAVDHIAVEDDATEMLDAIIGDPAGLHFRASGFVVAASGGGGGALTSVQEPDPAWESGTAQFQQTVTAITSGNGVGVVVNSPTAAGAPTLSDSAGGSWGSPLHTYNDANGWTTRFYARANITSGLTWVRATFAGNTDGFIGVVEVAGAGSDISLDDSDGAAQGTSTDWDFPVTSTVDGTLLLAAANLTNGSPPTGVSPVEATGLAGDYAFYARGILATAGAQTGEVDLVDGRNGGKAWVVLRAGA